MEGTSKLTATTRRHPRLYRQESFTFPMLTAEAADLAGCTYEGEELTQVSYIVWATGADFV
jgi:hypothetical protein